ncbi:MAG: hypothetical protein R3Y13_00845 [bacterium]
MANSKLIIVEGPQGVGKTTVTDFLRNTLAGTNLYRLSGTSDSTPTGKQKAKDMYEHLMGYTKGLENKSINLVFDRTFFTEENYCRLGKKDYIFTDVYEELLKEFNNLDFEIYYINLYLNEKEDYKKRLLREDKANVKYAAFSVENSVKQEEIYQQMSDEIKGNYKNINVLDLNNSEDKDIVQKKIREFINY